MDEKYKFLQECQDFERKNSDNQLYSLISYFKITDLP